MRFSTSCAATVALIALLPSAVLTASDDPCVEFVSKQGGKVTGLDANLWQKCIQNVPFDADKATETIKNLRIFLGMDTYAPYFLDPPTSQLELEPFNLNKTLSNIESNIKNGSYANNWSFDRDVVHMFQMFRDGHTDYETVCTHGFLYVHDFPIVSIASGDGLPELYHVIKDFSASPWAKPQLGSKIKKINGKEPQDYMDDFIRNSSEALDWVDPDARYNQILYGFPEGIFRGRFARRNMWDGEELRITWENGTDTLVEFTVQLLNGNLHQNGKLLFKDTESLTKLCFLSEEELASKVKRDIEGEKRHLVTRQASAPEGYPTALADSAEYAMSTYAVPGDSATVVLAIRTFEETDMDSSDFVNAMSTFLEDQITSWKESGYKRLIIDVSNNDGGKAILPYDILKQLFPTKEDFPTVNMHYSPITWAYMHSVSGGKENELYRDVNMQDFTDMKDFLGPVQKDGDWFTKMWKQDYVQFGEENYGINVSTAARTEQPFSAENIAVISNGLCASACHSLVESLSLQGVRTFAFGGRAIKSSPMQPVGGTKGGKVLPYDLVRQVLADMNENDAVIAAAGPADTWQLNTLPVRIKNLNINSENKFRDNTSLPLQFVYTPACNRFFMDSDMLEDVANVWKKTRAVAWGSDGKASDCVDYAPADNEESTSSSSEAASDDDAEAKDESNNGTGRIYGHSWLLSWLGLWGGVWLGFCLL